MSRIFICTVFLSFFTLFSLFVISVADQDLTLQEVSLKNDTILLLKTQLQSQRQELKMYRE